MVVRSWTSVESSCCSSTVQVTEEVEVRPDAAAWGRGWRTVPPEHWCVMSVTPVQGCFQ